MNLLQELPAAPAPAPPVPDTPLWDAIIIGAGPAGAVAAAILAQRRWRVLLVERSPWPRHKTCGGCLNHAGVQMLATLHLTPALQNAAPLTALSLRLAARSLQIPIPRGAAIARHDFDAHLVRLATQRGTTFLPQTSARILPADAPAPFRTLQLSSTGHSRTARAHIILAADGLSGTSLSAEPWAKKITARRFHLGFSTTLPAPELSPPRTIQMLAAEGAYVGLVQLPGNLLHLGASLSPASCNAHHGPAPVIARILDRCRIPVPPSLFSAPFTGTGPLTVHRPRIAGHRVLAIGDACGYVEPFTGEGISWAIRSAIEAATILLECPDDQIANRWQNRYESQIRHRQRFCRSLRQILHRPALAAICMSLAQRLPKIPALLAKKIST